jgi:hypothetical protein
MTEIGATLRETRMRARIDVSEIEAKTKIRARYLRALENEEWDLLPGPTFVRSFLRTYAQALGLDGKALVEEYRIRHEPPSDVEHQPVVATPRKGRSRVPAGGGGASARGYTWALGILGVVIALVVIGLLIGGKGGSGTGASGVRTRAGAHARHSGAAAPAKAARVPRPARASLSLQPSAAVYVCLIGDRNRKLIPGLIIEPPYTPVTFHATRFRVTLGNNAVTMYINGKPASVPPSSQAIGYSITSAGRQPLAPGQLPTCR